MEQEFIPEPASPLTLYLEHQRNRGTLDSTDAFTMNLDSAREKFGRYTSTRPASWVLRFIQCANEAGCPDIFIHQKRTETSLFIPETKSLSLQSLMSAYKFFRPAHVAEEHLLGGLLALDSLDGELIVEHHSLIWCPNTGEFEDRRAKFQGPKGLKFTYRPAQLSFWQLLRQRLIGTTSLLDEIQTYCYACRVNVYLDGRLYDLEPKEATLLSASILGDPVVALDIRDPLVRKQKPLSQWNHKPCKSIAYAVLCLAGLKRSRDVNLALDWCRSGVVIKREGMWVKNASGLFARALIPTENLSLDITGFSVREDTSTERRRRKGSQYLREGLTRLLETINAHERWPRFTKRCPPDTAPRESAQETADKLGALRREVDNSE